MIKKSVIVSLVLIVSLTALLTIINWNLNPYWKNIEGGIWYLLGNTIGYTTVFVLTLVSIINIFVSFNKKKSAENESIAFIYQLPETDKFFTGREKELKDLKLQFDGKKSNVFGIHGMGGLGKTTLAIRFAHEIAKNFEAHIFINTQGLSEKPYSAMDIMLRVVRSFYPMFSFSDDELVVAAYRTILNTKSVLIILDNIRNEAQLRDLLPSRNSVLIFTSREIFHRVDFYDIKLPLMSDHEASQLLFKITDRIDSIQAKKIAELCGCLPNAFVKAGNSIREYPVLDVDNYIEQLRLATIRVGLVNASANLSYNLLTEQLKVAWRELSIFPQSFGLEAASRILLVDYATCEKILFDLAQLSLINVIVINSKLESEDLAETRFVEHNGEDLSETRFAYHDLDRLFANSLMNTNERKGVDFRFADYYRIVITNLRLLYYAGGKDQLVALLAFDKEWVNIQKGQSLSAMYAKANKQMEDICFDYSVNTAEFIDLHLSYDVIVNWSKTAVRIAKRRKNVREEAIALNNLGTAYSNMGYPDKGIPLLMQSLEISAGLDDKAREADRLTNLGNAYRRKKDFEKALEFHFAALKIVEELKDNSRRASIANNIGNVYIELNDPKNSMYYHQLSLELAKKKGYLPIEATSMLALGVAYAMRNNIIKFLQYSNSAVRLARKLGSQRLIDQIAENSEHIFSAIRLGFVGKWYAGRIRRGN